MTAAEYLRKKAAALEHAYARDAQFDSAGRLVGTHDLHYASCVKCSLLREAAQLEREGKT